MLSLVVGEAMVVLEVDGRWDGSTVLEKILYHNSYMYFVNSELRSSTKSSAPCSPICILPTC